MAAFLRFVTTDWWIAWPMFFMSFCGLMCVFWRLLLNHNIRTDLNEFLPQFQERLKRDGVEGALKLCRTRSDLIPRRLFVAGLESAKQGTSAMRRAMANVVELEILPDLNFLLPTILAIAKIATMVGLFGTVISMIDTFQTVGSGDTAEQGKKIGLALFATAVGLITAIPLVFSHVLFKAWVAKYEVRMKSAAQKLLILVQNRQASGDGSKKGEKADTVASKQPGIDPRDLSPRR